MKNKEIEEILKYLKNNTYIPDETKRKYKILHRDEVDLLLSYIETIENRNKELYEGFIAMSDERCEYATKNEQLEKENKELKDIADEPIQIPSFLFDMTQELKIDELKKELQTTANKCKQLENNRDKAIECIKKQKKKMYKSRNKIALFILMRLENILKGDSDV